MTFADGEVLTLVERFCAGRRVAQGTRLTVTPNLAEALRIIELKGPDRRWSSILGRSDRTDAVDEPMPVPTAALERQVFEAGMRARSLPRVRRDAFGAPTRHWQFSHLVVSVAHWARLSAVLREAYRLGLGWLLPANREVLLVPRARLSTAEGRSDLLHDDTGRPAAEWADGSGYHFLQGAQFSAALYAAVVGGELSLWQIAELPDADQRSIALTYLSFENLLSKASARLVDRGRRGTTLYRIRLPTRIAEDRPRGHGLFDYFIHMRDASHPEREFVEWVDPAVGRVGDAEFCQAHAFRITLDEWLSIEQEG